MRSVFFIFLLTTTLFACVNSTSEEENIELKEDTTVLYGEREYDFLQLSDLAKEQVGNWGVLDDLISEIEELNGSNYYQLRTRSENVKEYSDSLANSIPETLNTNPINSRLLVLKTRAALLYETSHRQSMDTSGLRQAVTEMNLAIRNLVAHFNEKAQKDKIDMQRKQSEAKELEKHAQFKDSVMERELRNLNKD